MRQKKPAARDSRTARRSEERKATSRRQRLLGLAALAVVTLLAAGLVARGGHGGDGGAEAGSAGTSRTSPSPEAVRTEARGRPGASTGAGKPPKAKPSKSPETSASPGPGPKSGTGLFTTASASGGLVGHGATVRRYTVQVEGGSGISATEAARQIERVLADPRGWTANGRDSFQLVGSGPHDFEVKIATPDTVDRLCGQAGLDTHGEVNCDVGSQVIVNLKRWLTGSPEFSGPVEEYRALIINHEVGHRIGHGHETCPGAGRPAPAMMQQIYGLKGCAPNAWPYDRNGTYLGGPSVA
ncbi:MULTISPECIES: DUF3152 domain-containing protein [unclassified Streptomyces]|uniref:DUF3152 domain-containing protein n=1 Tax=unclassified Streptomyces TaxID=2593676 RepID=UPI00143AF70E|nr:DUF3152 domain-containing protein [Streptomyces sp. NEAU-H3]NJA55928.1 DUF3152 domain-containing protein [Streptomyces sp. NEAU-H3]